MLAEARTEKIFSVSYDGIGFEAMMLPEDISLSGFTDLVFMPYYQSKERNIIYAPNPPKLLLYDRLSKGSKARVARDFNIPEDRSKDALFKIFSAFASARIHTDERSTHIYREDSLRPAPSLKRNAKGRMAVMFLYERGRGLVLQRKGADAEGIYLIRFNEENVRAFSISEEASFEDKTYAQLRDALWDRADPVFTTQLLQIIVDGFDSSVLAAMDAHQRVISYDVAGIFIAEDFRLRVKGLDTNQILPTLLLMEVYLKSLDRSGIQLAEPYPPHSHIRFLVPANHQRFRLIFPIFDAAFSEFITRDHPKLAARLRALDGSAAHDRLLQAFIDEIERPEEILKDENLISDVVSILDSFAAEIHDAANQNLQLTAFSIEKLTQKWDLLSTFSVLFSSGIDQ